MNEIFQRAAELVSKGWSRGSMARDRQHCPIPYNHQEAAEFCIMGAIARAYLETGLHPSGTSVFDDPVYADDIRLLNRLAKLPPSRGIAFWNDQVATQESVIKLLQQAAEME